ncbi:MAG TPA: bifunctional enoyl-CoA hydratase/phosphate acetyltransferase [Rhodanobacteraceae bacterium]|nr:bifunctional enoyl-CoA hydratase/phosphate acetyltransferase [Rhodanobacteraceae bacterium]
MDNPAATANRVPSSRFDGWLEKACALGPLSAAIVHPCDERTLRAVADADRLGMLRPILVGPGERIRRAAAAARIDIEGFDIEDVPHSHAAAARAVALARSGSAGMLVKGALRTDELMSEVLDEAHGLRSERRASHVFALDVPAYPKPVFLTDGAINIAPGLREKRDIVQNAIDLLHAIGVAVPRVAILSAVETVNERIASTVEAAALCKMAERGQITGALLDGPLAFDNAISRQAAAIKGIRSPVAGDADILVVPDLVSGNMLAKQLVYLSDARSAGIVLGTRVPVALASRADDTRAHLISCVLARLLAAHLAIIATP